MRPSTGGDNLPAAKPRSRKSSVADHSAAHCNVPTTFFLRSEADMEQSMASSQSTEPVGKQKEQEYGVQSLAETLDAAFGQDSRVDDKRPQRRPSESSSKDSSKHSQSPFSSPARKHRRKVSSNTFPAPITPLNIDTRSPVIPSAIPSTPKSQSVHSLKLSDEESNLDDIASQAIASSGEEEDEELQQGESETSSFPQLVMPSIQMPTRRPFTDKGKAMGRLKVLIAGESGVGKTSLIRSIVQLCEDIVHVDPLSPSQSFSHSPPPPKSKSRKRKLDSIRTTRITENHASTKTYPHWWNDVEESKLRRRRSGNDSILERNLCFIDTPGYTVNTSSDDQNLVLEYMESLMYQNSSASSMEDSDLLGLIGGNGGVQVDVVFYLLSPVHDISKDVDFMQRLSALTNVIPIIAKSDILSASEVVAIKTSVLARLQTTAIKPFFFGKPTEDALLAVQGLPIVASSTSSHSSAATSEPTQYPFNTPTYPYAISSTLGQDTEIMDASLLMSPDYVQPLLPSELSTLVNQVFDPESIAWLRHSAAKKYLAWRRRTKLPGDSFILHGIQQQSLKRSSISSSSVGLNGPAMNASATSSIFSAASPSGVLVPRSNSPFYLSNYNSNLQSPFLASSPSLSHTQPDFEGPTDFSLARYSNYAQGEQKLAEVRLAKWATDLQRSLRNERERYEEMQRSERARWLLERVGEEVRDGNITTSPGGTPRADWAVVRHSNKESSTINRWGKTGSLDSRDPLGLCGFSDEVRRRGFVVVKVLGSVSILGAVMVAVVRACGVETGLPENGIWGWLTGKGE